MKIAILVDALVNKGGVERVILSQTKYLNADIYTSKYTPEATFEEFKYCNVIVIAKKVFSQRGHRLYSMFLFHTLKLKKYDMYLMYGGASLIAAKKNHPNMWFCCAPSRWMYDLYDEEIKKLFFPRRELFRIITYFLKKNDRQNVKNVDSIVSISKFTQERVQKYFQRESSLLYPFVDTKKFKYETVGDFYLCTGRVDPIKRQFLVVEAFKHMPDKKLIVAGAGPDLEKLKSIARGYENITILGGVSEEKLVELYATCIAVLYVSYKEDFGIVPLEAMASGKPCIATNDGGFKETIIHKKTGLLIDPTKCENIIEAVNWLTPQRVRTMRQECEEQAKRFSEDIFIINMKKAIQRGLP